jgi:[NiFe] hydrogenase diaphorase moiety large subunit
MGGMKKTIASIAEKYGHQSHRLIDIFWDIQDRFDHVPPQTIGIIATELGITDAEVEDTLTFYHFLHEKPAGKIKIYIDTSAVSQIAGAAAVQAAFEEALDCRLGETDPTGAFGLYSTACIGMSDQAPAALVDNVPVVCLNPVKVRHLVAALKKGVSPTPDVRNSLRRKGGVFYEAFKAGEALDALKHKAPNEIIAEITEAGIRGRGGAGFSTGKKWSICANQAETERYVVCNADEGEPGTFKDRHLLTYKPEMVIEGMVVAARAIGAQQGFIYLRAEYRYLKAQLETVLESMRHNGRLGACILGIDGFDFDIRIQLGAGAYVVGEETALLESLEGKRGEPRVRPPFPVEFGYLGKPTIVNNVETLASVSRIVKNGATWYRGFGTPSSPGTKLLSISGDVLSPGIYEVEWGISVGAMLEMAGADDPYAVQIGGPSGVCLDARHRHRQISFEDIPTGGSIMVFSRSRDLLTIIQNFVTFFLNESCGCCVPCRAGNIVLAEQMGYVLSGEAAMLDLDRIREWSKIISKSSRCGLGQTCPNPIISSLNSFPELYKARVMPHESLYRPFDVDSKIAPFEQTVDLYERES